jgi:hypothetical protein
MIIDKHYLYKIYKTQYKYDDYSRTTSKGWNRKTGQNEFLSAPAPFFRLPGRIRAPGGAVQGEGPFEERAGHGGGDQ